MPKTLEAPAAKKATRGRAAPTPKEPTIGEDGELLFTLRDRKRALEAEAKAIEDQAKEIEERLLQKMDATGVEKFSTSRGTLSISSSVVADVQDWDAFGAFVVKNKFLHLLQRRVSEPAYRELLDAGKKVPGVQPFTKKRLNMRASAS